MCRHLIKDHFRALTAILVLLTTLFAFQQQTRAQSPSGIFGMMGEIIKQQEAIRARKRAEQEAVKRLQTALSSLGYYQGKIDGDFGPLTSKAMNKFYWSKGETPPIKPTMEIVLEIEKAAYVASQNQRLPPNVDQASDATGVATHANVTFLQAPLKKVKSLSISRANSWIVIASRQDLGEAKDLAAAYAQTFPSTIIALASNDWYVISIGWAKTELAGSLKSILVQTDLVPDDAFVSTGQRFRGPIWVTRPDYIRSKNDLKKYAMLRVAPETWLQQIANHSDFTPYQSIIVEDQSGSTGGVDLFDQPNGRNAIIVNIMTESLVSSFESRSGWTRVKLLNGRVGWVDNNNLDSVANFNNRENKKTAPKSERFVKNIDQAPPDESEHFLEINTNNSFLFDGKDSDIVVLFNSSSKASHVTQDLKGNYVFDKQRAFVCWYPHIIADKYAQYLLKQVLTNKFENVDIRDFSDCKGKDYSHYDLFLIQRSIFKNAPFQDKQEIVQIANEQKIRLHSEIDFDEIQSKIEKRDVFIREIQSVSGEISVSGYGLLITNASNSNVCIVEENEFASHEYFLKNLDEEFPTLFARTPKFLAKDPNSAFVSVKRKQCGSVYGDVAKLKTIITGFKRDRIEFSVFPVWSDGEEAVILGRELKHVKESKGDSVVEAPVVKKMEDPVVEAPIVEEKKEIVFEDGVLPRCGDPGVKELVRRLVRDALKINGQYYTIPSLILIPVGRVLGGAVRNAVKIDINLSRETGFHAEIKKRDCVSNIGLTVDLSQIRDVDLRDIEGKNMNLSNSSMSKEALLSPIKNFENSDGVAINYSVQIIDDGSVLVEEQP